VRGQGAAAAGEEEVDAAEAAALQLGRADEGVVMDAEGDDARLERTLPALVRSARPLRVAYAFGGEWRYQTRFYVVTTFSP